MGYFLKYCSLLNKIIFPSSKLL